MRRKEALRDRKRWKRRFRDYIAQKIQNLRDNGDPRAADAQEAYWRDYRKPRTLRAVIGQ